MVEHWPFKPPVSGSSPDAFNCSQTKYSNFKLQALPTQQIRRIQTVLIVEYSQVARHRSLEPTSKVRTLLLQDNRACNSTVECSFDRREVASSNLATPKDGKPQRHLKISSQDQFYDISGAYLNWLENLRYRQTAVGSSPAAPYLNKKYKYFI